MSLVWGSLRNLLNFPDVVIQDELKLVGTVPGHFPVDAYQIVPLEVPRGRKRADLSGRFNNLTPALWDEIIEKDPLWARIVHLPLYRFDSSTDYENLRLKFSDILRNWTDSLIPESIPCTAIATRVRGGYCTEREAEFVFVLLVWPNRVSRILQLDWYEGPLEDCISPEWYITSSLVLPLQEALRQTLEFVRMPSDWTNLRMSIAPKPAFLGASLQYGNQRRGVSGGWLCEWDYMNRTEFLQDIESLLEDVKHLFTLNDDEK